MAELERLANDFISQHRHLKTTCILHQNCTSCKGFGLLEFDCQRALAYINVV